MAWPGLAWPGLVWSDDSQSLPHHMDCRVGTCHKTTLKNGPFLLVVAFGDVCVRRIYCFSRMLCSRFYQTSVIYKRTVVRKGAVAHASRVYCTAGRKHAQLNAIV